MSATFGECRLCGKGPDVRLYGDRVCAYHLGNPDAMPAQKQLKDMVQLLDEAKPVNKKEQARLLHAFFQEQAPLRPMFCENGCGKKLIARETWRLKAFCCHILPKKTFGSVMLLPDNLWYGCLDCHHDYDDKGWSHVVTMKVWPLVAERFLRFQALIRDSELTKLPDCFRTLISNL